MRLRLLLSFLLVVLVSVIGVALIARNNAASAVRNYMFGGSMINTNELVAELEDYYRTNNSWQGVESLMPTQGQHGMGMGRGQGGSSMMMGQRLRLADAAGNLIVDTAGANPAGQLTAEELASATKLQVDGKVVGYLYYTGGMGYSQGDEQMLVNRLTQAAITAGLIAGGLSLLLGLFLAYSLLRPVDALTHAAQRLGQGDLLQRVQVKGSDELAVLGRTFNHMADSLQQSEESRRAMTADIAHELRNPLAVQRANLEALQDGIYPLTAENLQPVLEQNILLGRLVEDLRTLALADAGQLTLECTSVDLASLVGRVTERFRPQADAQQVSLSVQALSGAASEASLWADPMRLEQILINLLSNALRFTPQGGKIELALAAGPAGFRVSIHDSGPGIPEQALPHIFERFYRVDRSRSRSEGGSGLGLAIAKQLSQAHGGSLSAANHPQGGAVFTLTLPARQTEKHENE